MTWLLDPYRIGAIVVVVAIIVFFIWRRWRAPGRADRIRNQIFQAYLDGVFGYLNMTAGSGKYDGLMATIEGRLDIPEPGVDDFRRTVAAHIGSLSHLRRKPSWDSHPELAKAIADLQRQGYIAVVTKQVAFLQHVG